MTLEQIEKAQSILSEIEFYNKKLRILDQGDFLSLQLNCRGTDLTLSLDAKRPNNPQQYPAFKELVSQIRTHYQSDLKKLESEFNNL